MSTAMETTKVGFSSETSHQEQFERSLRRILVEDPRQTEFQKQSMSERLEQLRQLGFKQDKILENEAFWAADRQRHDEKVGRQKCRSAVQSHQQSLRALWDKYREKK